MVRQFIRSAIRDCAVCTTGALCPSSRPAMTTAMTPEAWISSAAMKATKGTTNEIAVSSTGSVISLRSLATMTKTTKPTAAPPSDATRNSCPTWKASTPTDIAAMAVRSATSAVASLSSDSPSRIVTTLRGSPIRRAMAVAATASGGATTAPMAKETGQEMSGIKACTMTPTPRVVNTTRPTDSSRIARRLALKSTSEVWIAAAYSSGGSSPNSTTSGSRWISGTPGKYDARDADRDQQQRRREVDAVGQGGERQHGDGHGHEQDRDLHGAHCVRACEDPIRLRFAARFPAGRRRRIGGGVRRARRPSASGRPSRAPRGRACRTRARRACAGGRRR